jgi:hypothetical protein
MKSADRLDEPTSGRTDGHIMCGFLDSLTISRQARCPRFNQV